LSGSFERARRRRRPSGKLTDAAADAPTFLLFFVSGIVVSTVF